MNFGQDALLDILILVSLWLEVRKLAEELLLVRVFVVVFVDLNFSIVKIVALLVVLSFVFFSQQMEIFDNEFGKFLIHLELLLHING